MEGILFKPDMFQATLEGRKTQTRRVIKTQPPRDYIYKGFEPNPLLYNSADYLWMDGYVCWRPHKPRYQVGETVYIKEPIEVHEAYGESTEESYLQGYIVIYPDRRLRLVRLKDIPMKAEIHPHYQKMFMPEWAARYFINITSVTPQRLQEINRDDVLAEGVAWQDYKQDYQWAFAKLWDSINGKTYPWESNPWVWRYKFEVSK